jgi:protein tyrosine phosphatase (PTP) superfamily phosphohydrolase (DUF442 family)
MIEDLKNFARHSDKLISSGMPTLQQISSLAEYGVQVVINLATSESQSWIRDEKELVEAHGIVYYNIAVDWENPTADDLNRFMNIMDQHKHLKILVHCGANYRATGFIALYRINRLGWAQENAFKDIQKIWDPAEYPIWEEFIEKSLRAQS